jgi:hypothetical protein
MSWTRKPHRAIYVVRYEDMLQRPREMFRGLCRHLLLDPSDTQLLRAIELSSFEQAKAQEAEEDCRERPKQSKSFFRQAAPDNGATSYHTNRLAALSPRTGSKWRALAMCLRGYELAPSSVLLVIAEPIRAEV